MDWGMIIEQQRIRFDEFLQDCKNGDLAKIEMAEVSHINNVKSLICTIEYRQHDVLRLLLSKGANPNSYVKRFESYRVYINTTPLISAIQIGDLEAVKILIDYGANINLNIDVNIDWKLIFNREVLTMDKPSDDLYIKPVKQRTAEEIDYIKNYEIGVHLNTSPVQMAYDCYHDNIVDYLMSKGAIMKVKTSPIAFFPFPFTTLDETLRRIKLYFIKEMGQCEWQYSILRSQVRGFKGTIELLKDYKARDSAPYPRMLLSTAMLLPTIPHEFKSEYTALYSLFILEYWNETINSKLHIVANKKVDDIGYLTCQLIEKVDPSQLLRRSLGLE